MEAACLSSLGTPALCGYWFICQCEHRLKALVGLRYVTPTRQHKLRPRPEISTSSRMLFYVQSQQHGLWRIAVFCFSASTAGWQKQRHSNPEEAVPFGGRLWLAYVV